MLKTLALISLWFASVATIQFTGDAGVDFTDESIDPVTGRPRNFGVTQVPDSIGVSADGQPILDPDVGVPPQLPSGTISGWDVKNIWFQYDADNDELNVGIECFGVCGDADGNGDAGVASDQLTNLGGQDLPDLARGEGFAIALDFNLDVKVGDLSFDFILGIPAGQPNGAVGDTNDPLAVQELACSRGLERNELLNQPNCFGLYEYQNTGAVNVARRFLRFAERNGAKWPVLDRNPSPSLAAPDLEWTVQHLSELRESVSVQFTTTNKEPWTLFMQAFAGSFLDAGVGEDYLPSQNDFVEVNFPCLQVDLCGVCLGDGSTCGDCAGVPQGTNEYDACDVCGGDDTTCMDCTGLPNGPATYDVCDVCEGDNSSCAGCDGVPGSTKMLDACGVCDGDSTSCADCQGVPNGTAEYDACDVCNGDGSSCCGPHTGRECCVNYCMVPDPYWDFILLPKTLDNLIEKFTFTKEVFEYLCENFPSYDMIEGTDLSMQTGRMAEFTRLFLEECLEPFCESSATIYSQLVFDNSVVGNEAIPTFERSLRELGPKSHLVGPQGAK